MRNKQTGKENQTEEENGSDKWHVSVIWMELSGKKKERWRQVIMAVIVEFC